MTMPSPAPSTARSTLLGVNTTTTPAFKSETSLHPSTLFDVDGMVVVITGGGTGVVNCLSMIDRHYQANGNGYIYKGLGLMMATALENNGATVYIVGRRGEVLEKAASEHNVRSHPLRY